MVDFSQVKALDVSADQTARFTIYQWDNPDGSSPTLIVRTASQANRKYFNARLRASGRDASRIRAGKIDDAVINKQRDEDRELYAKHVIAGWEDVFDAKNKAVPFSLDACADLMAQLPSHLFDELRNFCDSPNNFIDSDAVDTEATAKN